MFHILAYKMTEATAPFWTFLTSVLTVTMPWTRSTTTSGTSPSWSTSHVSFCYLSTRTFCLNVFTSLSPCLLLGHLYKTSFRYHTNLNDLFKHFSLTVFRYSPQTRRDWEETNSGELTVFLHQGCHKSRILNLDSILAETYFSGYLFDTTAKRGSEVLSTQNTIIFFFLQEIRTNSHTVHCASIIIFKVCWKTDNIHRTHLNLFWRHISF